MEDIDDELKATDVLNNVNLKLASKIHIATFEDAFWTKLTLKNSSNKNQTLSLYNIIPGTNNIDVYIFKKNQQVAFHQLGDLQAQTKREEISRFSM